MTQTAKTIIGGVAILALLALIIFIGNRDAVPNSLTEEGATSTEETMEETTVVATTTVDENGLIVPEEPTAEQTSKEKACTSAGGTWDPAYNECTDVDEGSCKAAGGTYDDCASPCRNDPDAEACIQMCVAVCIIK